MRILLISDDFLPRVGGVSHMMDRLACAFGRAGSECAVVAPHLDGQPRPQTGYRIFWHERGADTHRFARKRRARDHLRGAIDAFSPDRLLLGTHFHYGPASLELGAELGVPVGLYTHGLDLRRALCDQPHPFKSQLAKLIRVPTFQQQAMQNVAAADYLFANSRYTAELVRSAGARVEVCVTGCGIDLERLERERAETPHPDAALRASRRRAIGLPDRPTVGFLGRLVPSKNALGLVEAVARLPGVQLAVAGDGPEREAVERRADELGALERVTLLGSVSEDDKWQLLRCLDAFCLPSREMTDGPVEGFGIVVLEALAAGAPVVVGRSGGMPDAVADGEAGLIADPDRPEDLARAIATLLEQPEAAKATVAAGRRLIAERFNWDAIAERILSHLAN